MTFKKWVPITCCVLVITLGCVDQIEPEFERRDNLIFVDAYLTTEPGFSLVQLSRSGTFGSSLRNLPERGAMVQFIETTRGNVVSLEEFDAGTYFPPPNFGGREGEVWMLEIQLADGKIIQSSEEIMTKVVPIEEIKAELKEELRFEEAFDRFVPGHTLAIDWTDPGGENNFYMWRYKSYEPIVICQVCEPDELWRNGSCIQVPRTFSRVPRTYTCETDCWQIRYHDRFKIVSDALFDGKPLSNFSVADILFHRDAPILIDLVMLNLNSSSYEFLKIIQDLQEESRGLNAPPPAPLFGNLSDPIHPDEPILGQFIVAASSRKSIYLERDNVKSRQLEDPIAINPEICNPSCVTHLPCEESLFRTALKPDNWPE